MQEDDMYKKDFDINIITAKHIENLKIEGLTVSIEAVDQNQSWYSHNIFCHYQGYKIELLRRYNDKGFTLYIRANNKQNGSFRYQAKAEAVQLQNYSFEKVTAKKFIAKLGQEIFIHNRSIELFEEHKEKNLIKYDEACSKIKWLADKLGRETETVKDSNNNNWETFKFKYDSKAPSLYALKCDFSVSINRWSFDINIDYYLDDTIRIFEVVGGLK